MTNSRTSPSSYVQATRAVEQTQFYTTKDLLNPYLEDAAHSPLATRMSRKPDLRLATELLQEAPMDLRPRNPRIPEPTERPPQPAPGVDHQDHQAASPPPLMHPEPVQPATPAVSASAAGSPPATRPPQPARQVERPQSQPRPSAPTPATPIRRPAPTPAKIPSPTPGSHPLAAAASGSGGYQRLRLPAVERHVGNGFILLASCVDGGSPEHCHRPPPPPGHPMPYAADSIRVQRIAPSSFATMPLSAVTALGMFSLLGTGSQETVRVACQPDEAWILTVGDSLGFISAQDDIAGATALYGKPAIIRQLEYLDQLENELRPHLPGPCLLLSLFACVRREISWLLPTAADPHAVTIQCLQRFCEMLFRDPVAYDLFTWYGEEVKQIDAPALFYGLQPLLKDIPYLPSEDTLRALCFALVKRQPVKPALTACMKSLDREHPDVRRVADFDSSIAGLLDMVDTLQAIIAKRRLSAQQHSGILNALCRAAKQAPYRDPHYFGVLGHPIQIDHQGFDKFRPLAHIWQYATNYVLGKQAEMNRKYRAFLDD